MVSAPTVVAPEVRVIRPRMGFVFPAPDVPEDEPRPRWVGWAAVLTALVAMPIAYALPRIPPYEGGAGSPRAIGLPLMIGFIGVLAIFAVAQRLRTSQWLAGVAAGGFGAWIVLSLSTALRGTPFPFYGLVGDAGRVTGMANRFSVTAQSADLMMPGLPSEYPPLFPWVVGRFSWLTGTPAWQLTGDFEIWFTAFGILAGFLLWLRLLKPWPALAVTVLAFMTFPLPVKAYETATLMVLVPWFILTFGKPARGRLHWLVAGLAGAFVFLAYFGWLIFASIGILAVAWHTWRHEEDRKAFLVYLAKVIGVVTLLSSWFLVPLIKAKITIGGEMVSDLYGSSGFHYGYFPFLDFSIIGVLQLAGLAGMILLYRRTWWAPPMLLMVLGLYTFRILATVYFVLTDHSMLAQYVPSIYSAVMAAAAVPTLIHVVPKLLERLTIEVPKAAAAGLLAVAVAWSGYAFCIDWMPFAGGRFSSFTERAYNEPLPDGTYAEGILTKTPWFPVDAVQEAVERHLGRDHDAVTLSIDERLYAYLPWHGYLGNDLWSTVAHSPTRLADVQKLAATKDPAAFTTQAQHLTFGRIDVFILKKHTEDLWRWEFHQGYNRPKAEVSFSREQFGPDWIIEEGLPEDVVVAIHKR